MRIERAAFEDLPEVLALQKLAYQSEAQLVHDFSIPPLTQTLCELEEEYACSIVLKAVEENAIVGSVRGTICDSGGRETLRIGRLFVSPAAQNRGIGRQLLSAIEAEYIGARYELFTSDKSDKNLALYHKSGYREFKRERINENVVFVFLEK